MELLILFEQWAGHRLLSEKVARPHVRAGRPILLPSVPVSEGIEIRHGCQFLSSLVRALSKRKLGSHLSRLRHLGWNQCSHGLDSRPLESCHHQCPKALCGVLGYPRGSALELLDGTLKLRHCTNLFTKRFPPWSLPRVGSQAGKRHFVSTDVDVMTVTVVRMTVARQSLNRAYSVLHQRKLRRHKLKGP